MTNDTVDAIDIEELKTLQAILGAGAPSDLNIEAYSKWAKAYDRAAELFPRLAARAVADATVKREVRTALGSAEAALQNRANARGKLSGPWNALAGAALYDVRTALAKLGATS